MQKFVQDVLKNTLTLFAVGVALAIVAPPLATMLGAGVIGEAALAHAVATPVLWTGAFFGAFGGCTRPLGRCSIRCSEKTSP